MIVVSAEQFSIAVEKEKAFLKADSTGRIIYESMFGEEVCYHVDEISEGIPGRTLAHINKTY